jgi:hypothetical protein
MRSREFRAYFGHPVAGRMLPTGVRFRRLQIGLKFVLDLAEICTFRLDFRAGRISIEVSPPIQFRIEWADSQGMSPLLGCRPI